MAYQNNNQSFLEYKLITAGSGYLDIDAYACAVAMAELLRLKGENAFAFSSAPFNYSICDSLIDDGQILRLLPNGVSSENAEYIIVDVSDPDFLKDSVALDRVVAVYDHHVGFEEYWTSRIGDNAHIEFVGAAATLIYREWKLQQLQDKMSRTTALLLIAAILDNTLNLTSSNTTSEDVAVFDELCQRENITSEWCSAYFSEVQKNIESDLKNAIFKDIKNIQGNPVLPHRVAQLCVWNAENIILKLPEIRALFCDISDSWMINIIDIKNFCSYFVCDSIIHQKKLEYLFDITFEFGVAKTKKSYLRKEIIKKALSYK